MRECKLNNAQWRKSSYSNEEGGSCVEVFDNLPGIVPVRDSKNPTGPVLMIAPSAWTTFVDEVGRRR
ncbi:DUF397 domain-containing protein [Streptomyces tsukubensis]|uniref:DUF397 domain-containing protein n=1 Tax=Streptomyces tsukubensis TaxID=83656 RepID=A0A1V4ABR2_9ACTN|nr:DUF397 domain-containing protein [Streptomyces tsukubensis]OON80867.1 DUF397 domain-containing protein [Streptomyces tsukubensis]QFR93491.1 DUF397 domain-containing protein [Streptomyces tsukubensis]